MSPADTSYISQERGCLSIAIVLSHWLRTAYGKSDLSIKAMMDSEDKLKLFVATTDIF